MVFRLLKNLIFLSAVCLGVGCGPSNSSANSQQAYYKISETPVLEMSKDEMAEQKRNLSFGGVTLEDVVPTECGLRAYKVQYQTVDVEGKSVLASGILAIPIEKNNGPLLSYQHGTTTLRANVPSNPGRSSELVTAGFIFGGSCYAIVAADYLGLGDHMDQHPYLHADTEASAAKDLILSGIPLMKRLNYKWNQELYLSGYSQGGHATMALHRLLETNNILPVTASTPMGGPYDFASSTKTILSTGSPSGNIYAGYVIMSLHRYFGMYKNLNEAVESPYDQALPGLFDGTKSSREIHKVLPSALGKLLTVQFRNDVMDSNSQLSKFFQQNTVYDWAPKAPVHLFHASGDNEVPFANAATAKAHMTALGSSVTLTDVGAKLDHGGAFMPSMLGAYTWYKKFRK